MPDYNLNWVGSSGWGTRPDGTYGPMPPRPRPTNTRQEYAVWDTSSGRTVSVLTGKPFTGTDPRTGLTFNNGVQSAASAPSAPSAQSVADRYRPVEVIKSPEVAGATSDLMEQFRTNAASALTDFNTLTNQFKPNLAAAQRSSQEAQNITPTVEALTAAQRGYTTDLEDSRARYEQALTENAAAQRGVVAQAEAGLPDYDRLLSDIVTNRIARNIGDYNARYGMTSGTPRSGGSAQMAAIGRIAADTALPIELEKLNRRYDIQRGMRLPVEQGIGASNIAFAGGYLPGIASSRYASGTQLPMTIQQLREQAAAQGYSDIQKYLSDLELYQQYPTRLLGGQAGTLGALAQLEEMSRYRGLEDVQGAQVTPQDYYNLALPPYPQTPTRYPVYGGPNPQANPVVNRNPLNAPNAPIEPGTFPGYSPEDLYYLYGLTPEDYASMGYGVPTPARYTPNAAYAYQGPGVNTTNLIPEYSAGGVG